MPAVALNAPRPVERRLPEPVPPPAEVQTLAPAEAPEAAPPRHPRWRNGLLGAAAALFVAVGAAAGWEYWQVWRFQVSTDDAYLEADSVAVAPQVSGRLVSVEVVDNQSVRAGDLLAVIDDRPYAAALAQARAEVAAAGANVDSLRAQLAAQQSVIAAAEATVAADKASLLFAEQDKARFGTLASKGYGSVQNAQEATSRSGALAAQVAKDQADAEAAHDQVAILQARLQEAQGLLARAQAVERTAALNLEYTRILAPIDGVIGERTLRVGQVVAPGTLLLAVVPLREVYVVANYKETQLTDVRAGQPVTVEVDAFPGVKLTGVVDSLAPASGQEFALLPPDNATGNFTKVVQRVPVRIRLAASNPLAGLLRPGMSVTPTIDVSPRAESPR